MAALLSCSGVVNVTPEGVPQCDSWVLVDSATLTNTQNTAIDPAELVEAFGAGFMVAFPLFVILWKIKALKAAVKTST